MEEPGVSIRKLIKETDTANSLPLFFSESSERGRKYMVVGRIQIISWQPAKTGHGLGTSS